MYALPAKNTASVITLLMQHAHHAAVLHSSLYDYTCVTLPILEEELCGVVAPAPNPILLLPLYWVRLAIAQTLLP